MVLLLIGLLGCSGSPSLTEADVMTRLQDKGFTVERQQGIALSQGELDRLPTADEMFTIRLSNNTGRSGPITLVRFKNAAKATKASQARVNGFATQNWFFAGLISVDIENAVKEALK